MMATFYVTVSATYSVEIDDTFIYFDSGNHDAIADEIADSFFAGECSLIEEEVLSFEPADQSTDSVSF